MAIECDVLIVGGGVAGVSIAERLSREAARRGGGLSILVVEKSHVLGSGASGKLEGWYHSGALYGGFEDPACFAAAREGMRELLRSYADDDAFEAHTACRLDGGSGWFHAPIDYLLPRASLAPVSGDSERTRQQRMVDRVAPTLPARAGDRPFAPRDAIDDVPGHPGASALARERRRLLQDQVDLTDLALLPTMDRVMDTPRILRDLTRCAWTSGVHVRTGMHVAGVGDRRSCGRREAVIVDGVGRSTRVMARHVVLSAGSGLGRGGRFGHLVGAGGEVSMRRSVMVVIARPLGEHSFAHIGLTPQDDFSHLYQPTLDGGYSIIADSNSSEIDAGRATLGDAADHLMDKAERFFGDEIRHQRRARWYSCVKVESRGDAAAGQFAPWVSEAGPGLVCVLPGKFSMFAALSQSVLDLMVDRGLFKSMTRGLQRRQLKPAPVHIGRARSIARSMKAEECRPTQVELTSRPVLWRSQRPEPSTARFGRRLEERESSDVRPVSGVPERASHAPDEH